MFSILQTINKYPYYMLTRILAQSQHCYSCLLVYLVPSRPLVMKAWIELLLLLSRFTHVQLYATPWTAAHQAPLSTRLSRQEYWSRLPFPSLLISIVDVFTPFIFHIIIEILWPRSEIHCLFSVFSLCILFITFIPAFLWVIILFDF